MQKKRDDWLTFHLRHRAANLNLIYVKAYGLVFVTCYFLNNQSVFNRNEGNYCAKGQSFNLPDISAVMATNCTANSG